MQEANETNVHFVLKTGSHLETIGEFTESFEDVRLKALKLSSRGEVIAAVDDKRHLSVLLFNPGKGIQKRWESPFPLRDEGTHGVAVSPSGWFMALACEDGYMRVYETGDFS